MRNRYPCFRILHSVFICPYNIPVDERTQEWLNRTRQLDRKHAIRGGVQRDSGAIKQTSATVVGALAVIAVLLISPIRLSETPIPTSTIPAGAADRVNVAPESPAGRAVRVVGAIVPPAVLPPMVSSGGAPIVPPHVPIWTGPRVTGKVQFEVPSELPPAEIPSGRSSNLVTR